MSGLGVLLQAGGPGTRLRPMLGDLPKALAPFAGSTLLDYQFARIAPLRPERLVVLACAGAEAVRARVADRAEVLVERTPLGTAGGLCLLPPTPARWLVLNVDHVGDADLAALAAHPAGEPCLAVVCRRALPIDEGVVSLYGGRIQAWQERPTPEVVVTTGLYRFDRAALVRALDGSPTDMPALVRRLIPEGVRAIFHEGTWLDAGTPERLRAAEAWLHAAVRPGSVVGLAPAG